MKRCLFIIITVLLFFLPLLTGKSFSPRSPLSIPTAFAQTQPTLAPSPTPSAGSWVQDPTVTFLGQTVSRAENFMDWTLVNYKWDYLDTALTNIWAAIRNIVYAMLILVILGAAFLIVISGGSNVGVLVFTRKFILALILITFSFAIARFLYEIADIFQVFFFHVASPNGVIIGKDIVNISFLNSAKDFVGYRLTGIAFDESAFISLLLIKLSAVTFYVIGCILTVRKIILWFFLVVSPLYPIIALYFPLRNTAKVWLIEFLRWLLYAPLFALFLSAIVIIWKNTSPTSPSSLGLNFNFGTPPAVYQTAISILVGGPGQQLSLTNSLNYPDTFIQFVVALLMLWVAILMPFILLQLFLDFLAKYEFGKAPMLGQLNNFQNRVINNGFSFFKKSTPPSPLPTGQFPAGEAREIPRENAAGQRESSINRMTTISSQRQEIKQPIEQRSYTQSSSSAEHLQTINQILQNNITNEAADNRQTTQVAQRPQTTIQFKPAILARTTTRLVSFPIPTMRDIVRFETARLQRTKESTQELQEVQETLEKIANPQVSTTAGEKQHYAALREQLNQEKTKGDVLAGSILSAASTLEKPQVNKEGKVSVPATPQTLPVVNQIQTVSFDDYEAVKALWLENYQDIDVPSEKYSSRKSWIEDDGKAISQAITLLSSPDPIKVREGLASVSAILPFLLIGGFSQTEVIAYLKAKLAAGKAALQELAEAEESQETLLAKGTKKDELKQLSEETEIDVKDEKDETG